MTATLHTDRAHVLAFRLDGHNLLQRQPFSSLLEVAAACGLRNTPPGSAALALNARLTDLPADACDNALAEDKTLVEVLSVRLSPYVVPTRDVAVFTLGALPVKEDSLRAVLSTLVTSLDQAGLTATEALHLAADAAYEELDGKMLTKGMLSGAMTRRLPEALCPWCAGCGTHHVQEGLFRLVGVRGIFCFAPRAEKGSAYLRTDQWLGQIRSEDEAAAARAALLRRYLRCYGPSTCEHFAAWVGITPADARSCWDSTADQRVAVDVEGHRAWLAVEDVDRFESLSLPAGVRLLPPYDAYLDQRDRALLLPDKALQRRVWKNIGNPGVVLADGEIVAVWRTQKKGKRLLVTIEAFVPIAAEAHAAIEAEAALLASYRGCATAEVAYSDRQ